MNVVETIVELRQTIRHWRQLGESIALVPTMGNLHAGHLSLVKAAQAKAKRVVVTIFVNPTQFGPSEDYTTYPRTFTEDKLQLIDHDVDLLFFPAEETMYSENVATSITVAGISERYCGASRPGHFNGVATIVAKLFNLVQPDIAFFGEKDFQQLAVIRKMVHDLNIPVTLQSVATVRETDGLALSSRNGYLTLEQRRIAPALYQTLCFAKTRIESGETDYRAVEAECVQTLKQAGFEPDYVAICRSVDLQSAGMLDQHLVILAAARLGRPRLIDNIRVERAGGD